MSSKTKILALFDFDHTILSADSSGEFIRFAFAQSKTRRVLLRLATPLFALLSISSRTHWRRNWLYYQFAVGGKSQSGIAQLKKLFYHFLFEQKKVDAYSCALQKITHHQQSGHDVVIISGSLQWLLEELCEHFNIQNVAIFGSHKAWFCYGANKVTTLRDNLLLDEYQEIHGYSDSAADIPMLSLCTHKTVVNPKRACAQQFAQAFGDQCQVVRWETKKDWLAKQYTGKNKTADQNEQEPTH